MATMRDRSREVWTGESTVEHINAGSLQRIADATEKLAGDWDRLQRRVKFAEESADRNRERADRAELRIRALWVIAGGESGPHARPAHPDWFRSLRDQCAAAGVPFHFKQWGEWASCSEVEGAGAHYQFPDGATVRRVGKTLAGRLLGGVEHNGFPRVEQGA